MKRTWKIKMVKIIGALGLFLFLLLSFGVYRFSQRKSDEEIVKSFAKDSSQVYIKHLDFNKKDIRVLDMQKELDTTLPTLVFVHGSPGAAMDFKKYFTDTEINSSYNVISYDRIGYGYLDTGEVLNSISEEVEVLHKVLQHMDPKKIVLVAYSYGGTIALASDKNYMKKIILAGAVKGDLEPMFWALNFYQWALTRPLVPKIFQAAAQEKLKHVTELPEFDNKWGVSEASVLSIHGKKDRIVPYENSLYLKDKIAKDKFTLLSIENGNHALVWTDFALIKNEILKVKELEYNVAKINK